MIDRNSNKKNQFHLRNNSICRIVSFTIYHRQYRCLLNFLPIKHEVSRFIYAAFLYNLFYSIYRPIAIQIHALFMIHIFLCKDLIIRSWETGWCLGGTIKQAI